MKSLPIPHFDAAAAARWTARLLAVFFVAVATSKLNMSER
jgi:hypothetical protein